MQDDVTIDTLSDEAPTVATKETETEDQVSEATNEDAPEGDEPDENPDGQKAADKSPKSEDAPEDEVKKTRNERRRERMAQLEREAQAAADRLAKITNAGQGEEPKEIEFDDYAEYVAAKAVYRARQTDSDTARTEAETQRNSAAEAIKRERAEAYSSQLPEARQRYADYDTVVNTAPISDALADQIVASDSPTDLAYRIASNPAEASRLSALPPVQMARELGRIEASITSPQPKRISSAPAPIKPVNASGKVRKEPSDMSMGEYEAWVKAGRK